MYITVCLYVSASDVCMTVCVCVSLIARLCMPAIMCMLPCACLWPDSVFVCLYACARVRAYVIALYMYVYRYLNSCYMHALYMYTGGASLITSLNFGGGYFSSTSWCVNTCVFDSE
jgi:hypothetical protein